MKWKLDLAGTLLRLGSAVSAGLLCWSCGTPIEEIKSGCDPLDPGLCALPFPSSLFLEEDASAETGLRVALGEFTLPMNRDGVQMRPDFWNRRDGFSTTGGILAWFDDLDPSNLPSHTDLSVSISDSSPIVLLDLESGERIPFWAELDSTAEDDSQRLLLIRPAVTLAWDTTYVVGIRDLQKKAGEAVDVSEAFAALRDGRRTDDWDVESRRERFDDLLFPALESAGFERDELQLAWDFHTASRSNTLGRLEFMRDDALATWGEAGPSYVITEVEERTCDGDEVIGRVVKVDMTVPMYTEDDRPPTFLTRDESGMPFQNGETTVPFQLRIPCSVLERGEPAQVVQYGHGLLGKYTELGTGWLNRLANEEEWVIFGVSWTGMKSEDSGPIALMMVSDPSNFAMVPERSHQGMVEALGAASMVLGDLGGDEALSVDGVSLIDPERFGYYGNSQGAIMGGAYVSLSPHIQRGVLGVGGGPYSLLLSRSVDFDPFFLLLKEKYLDHRNSSLFVHSLVQQLWDPTECAGWLNDMATSDKRFLQQVAIADAQVTTLGAHIIARAQNAKTVAPETRSIWGIEEAEPGFEGSALVEYLYTDIPGEPVENLPPDGDYDPHECPRREPAGQKQAADFIATGVVNQYCDGICESLRDEVCPG